MKKKIVVNQLTDLLELYKSMNAISSSENSITNNFDGAMNPNLEVGFFNYDLAQQQIAGINLHAKTIFNCGDYQLKESGLQALYSNVHQDDLPKLIFLESRLFQIAMELGTEYRTKVELEYHFRVKHHAENYKWIMRRSRICELDKYGKPCMQSNLLVDVTRTKKDESIVGYINHPIEGELKINAIVALNGGHAPISDRENDILKKLSKGMLSKDVADHFCLSPETVHRHRKKILKKLDANNMIEAIHIAQNLGLL